MASIPNSPEEQLEQQAANDWDLESLYKDLASAKQIVAPHKRKGLTVDEKPRLCGLLCGYSPAEIAPKLHIKPRGLEAYLCDSVYRYVEQLTKRPRNTVKNWRDIPEWLEEAGYKTQLSESVKGEGAIANSLYIRQETEKEHSKVISAVGNLVNFGLDHYRSGNYYKVIEYYQQLRLIAKTSCDIQGEVASLTHLGYLYYRLGNWEKALEFYQESLVKLKTTCVPNLEGIILGSMGNVYFACVDYEQAINFYEKALKIWQLNHNLQSEAHVLDKLEKAYRALGQYDKAIERNQRYLAILRDRIPLTTKPKA